LKIPKRELKRQQELAELFNKERLTDDEIELIYEEWNPAMISSIVEDQVYFTPFRLGLDTALFASRHGNILDLCGGIGCLTTSLLWRDHYDKNIKSITLLEKNPDFIKIAKKLINDPRVKFVCGDAFDKDLLDSLVADLPDQRFDSIISNPPYCKAKLPNSWLNYSGALDLCAVEVCLRYAKSGYFILPVSSVPWKFSGERFYQEHIGRELQRFIKANQDIPHNFYCDGIDCQVYAEDWKNLKGIRVESVRIEIHPWSLDCLDDSITFKKMNPLNN
jgi:hypothetical protein